MQIAHLKLTKYVSVLRKYIPASNSVDEIHQSMDGIEELCSLLRIKSSTSYGQPVERAFEAAINEPAADAHSVRSLPPINTSNGKPARKNYRSQAEAKRDIAEMMRRSADDSEFEIVVNDAGVVETLSSLHDLSIRSSTECVSDTEEIVNDERVRVRYEIPDDNLMSRKATKILGDRKEVEMQQLAVSMAAANGGRRRRRDLLSAPDEDPSGDRERVTRYEE